MVVCVLTWEYSDRSAHGIERAYLDRARAEQDLALAEKHSLVVWNLVDVEVVGQIPCEADD